MEYYWYLCGLKLYKMKYNSINDFELNRVYETKNGDSVLVDGIDDEPNWKKVHFIINDCMRDMQSHENFLAMMNGEKHDILNF